jgi:hypothetical protein
MSDDLTPEEEQVRRLLADARHTEPLPDDLAARMDAVLADLRRERPTPLRQAEAADRPAWRKARGWLIAAAAVVVIGTGLSRLDLTTSGGSDGGSDASASDAGGAGSAAERERAGGEALLHDRALRDAVPLRSRDFGAQVRRLDDSAAFSAKGGPESGKFTAGESAPSAGERRAGTQGCRVPALGQGRTVVVRYDGRPGVLVFRPVSGDTEVVDLFLCGGDDVERSITLPER